MIDNDYDKYLESDKWKRIRQQRINHDGGRCKNCGSTVNLQVHHKEYDSYGDENIKEHLVTLCSDCHRKVTEINRRKRRVYCG